MIENSNLIKVTCVYVCVVYIISIYLSTNKFN